MRQGQGQLGKPPLTSIVPPDEPWIQLGMDVLKLPLTESGMLCFMLQCYLTKYLVCYPMANEKAETIAKLLINNFVPAFEIPEVLLTDQGNQFTSRLFDELTKLLGIQQTFTTVYHPQTDGLVERPYVDEHLGKVQYRLRLRLGRGHRPGCFCV